MSDAGMTLAQVKLKLIQEEEAEHHTTLSQHQPNATGATAFILLGLEIEEMQYVDLDFYAETMLIVTARPTPLTGVSSS